MRRIFFFGIGIILILLAGWGVYKITKPHRNVSGENATARLTATNLYNEFLHTEDQANKKWVGQVIEISGTISSVAEMGNYVSINLQATADGGVNCSILKKDIGQNEKILKGDSITIKGKCTGFLMDVNMVDCIIVK